MYIRQDHTRFKEIVRDRVRRDLRKHMANGELIARHGDKTVRVPVPRIEIPRFRFGDTEGGRVGQGPGEVGDAVGQGDGDGEAGAGEAGDAAGDKGLDMEVTLEELAAILGEELELPNIQPRGNKQVPVPSARYSGMRPVGPESLRSFKRTYKEAIKRMIASGEYDAGNPVVVPRREDRRYRSLTEQTQPSTQAVIIYMMDVSGSMGDVQKETVRLTSFWIDTWLRSQYKSLDSRYIIHDATAREVDRDTFYRTRESGGTMISSAYEAALDIIEADYPADAWNVYPFHFSDGDNWSVEDTVRCMDLLSGELVPRSNMFCYGQVDSPYGSGQFLRDLSERFAGADEVVTAEIKERESIYDAIRTFLGRGL